MSDILTEKVNVILADLKAVFPSVKTIDHYPGSWTLKELQGQSTKCPAFYLAPSRIVSVRDTGQGFDDVTLAFSLAVLTTDVKGIARHVGAASLVSALAKWMRGRRFGVGSHPVEAFSAVNRFGGSATGKKVMFWEVTWRQAFRVGEEWLGSDDAKPTTIYASWAPNVGVEHVDDYREIDVAPEDPVNV